MTQWPWRKYIGRRYLHRICLSPNTLSLCVWYASTGDSTSASALPRTRRRGRRRVTGSVGSSLCGHPCPRAPLACSARQWRFGLPGRSASSNSSEVASTRWCPALVSLRGRWPSLSPSASRRRRRPAATASAALSRPSHSRCLPVGGLTLLSLYRLLYRPPYVRSGAPLSSWMR